MRTRVEERTFFSWEVKERLLKETGGKCAHCGTPLDRYTNLTVDHFFDKICARFESAVRALHAEFNQ